MPLLAGLLHCTTAAPVVHAPPPERPAPSAAPPPSVIPTAEAVAVTSAVASVTPPAEPPPPPAPREGQDFADEARLLYRVAACSGDAPVPAELQKAVDDHCKALVPKIDAFKTRWLGVAKPFLASIVPADSPKSVVYPFAGGDNATMIATYPNAEEYTSISLELTGDVRKVHALAPATLPKTLRNLRVRLDELLGDAEFSQSDTLQKMMTGEVPYQLSFLMVGLAIHELEPVSLRYFKLEKNGAVHYFTAEEIAKDKSTAKRRSNTWGDGDFSEAFSNVEIDFKPRGQSGPVQVHRHIAFNLDNAHLKADPSLLAHLESKGDVSGMIKAASYLLWRLDFSHMRDYVLGHFKLIVSDSTVPLPKDVAAAGYTQRVWGRYMGSHIPVAPAADKLMKAFWATQPEQPLAFRYGYRDSTGKPHLMLTTKK